MYRTVPLAGIALCAALTLAWIGSALAAEEPAAPAKLRVGTFDARSVALAYYRSPIHNQFMQKLMEDHKQAKAAGDTDTARGIEKQASDLQDLTHRQVFGVGPYDSLVEQLKTVLPEVAKAAEVDVIVERTYYAAPGVQSTDVTGRILDQLQTDEKTRKMIQDMQEKIRTGQYKPEQFKGEH